MCQLFIRWSVYLSIVHRCICLKKKNTSSLWMHPLIPFFVMHVFYLQKIPLIVFETDEQEFTSRTSVNCKTILTTIFMKKRKQLYIFFFFLSRTIYRANNGH